MQRALVFAIIVASGVTGFHSANASDGTEIHLKNDLTVLLKPIPNAESVCVMTLFNIGNDHDPSGQSGLAHLIEHLYVCSEAGERPSRTVQQFIQEYPYGWNAQTGDDFTLYATVVPRKALNAELRDAANRMSGLTIDPAVIEREKGRLIAEVSNMFGGKPDLAAFNQARQLARPGQKGTRRGGVPEQVSTITADDIRKQLEKYYKPNNAILVIAGGFDPDATRKEIEILFRPIPAGEAVPTPDEHEQPQLGKRITKKITPSFPGSLPQVVLAFRAPLPTDPQYVSFLTIATRLMLKMQGNIGDTGFHVHFAPLDDPAALILRTSLGEGETVEQTVTRLMKLLDDACSAPLSPSDILAVANGLGVFLGVRDLPDDMWMQNSYGLAFSIGRRYQLRVDVGELRAEMEKMSSGTMQKATELYLGPESRITLIVQRGME